MSGGRKLLAALFFAAGLAGVANTAYIPAKGLLADRLMARAWTQSQAQGYPVLPWASMDARPLARLSVDRLGASEVILDVATGQALGFAPAHMAQTPRPGQAGLSVIAAHKNTHFAFLENIKPGDIISLENIDRSMTRFKVTGMDVVDKDKSGIDVTKDSGAARIALVTCYPFSALSYGGPLRYVVYGEAI